jgi:tryptophanyl-tRNA synthetase
MVNELTPIRERAKELQSNPKTISETLDAGAEKARHVARATLKQVKEKMGLPLSVGA